jgi:RNA polymerase subunit RPABC4/transcription elongation factor Spt4
MNTVNICDGCKRLFPELIICPKGAELCAECFERGDPRDWTGNLIMVPTGKVYNLGAIKVPEVAPINDVTP